MDLRRNKNSRPSSNARARRKAVFEQFAYSHQKAYVDWIEDSKKEETRARRIDKAIELLAEGKRLK